MPTLKLDIAFDLDGTLVDMKSLLGLIIDELYGAKIVTNGKFRIKTNPPLTDLLISDAIGMCFKRVGDFPIYNGVSKLMQELYVAGEGDPVTIVTARPYWAANNTYELLERIFDDIPFRLIMVPRGKDKIKYLRGIDNFVDDRRKTAIQLSQHKKYVFVPRRSYNEINFKVENLKFIDSVADLTPYVNEFTRVDVRYA